jgi:hypothetical protein
MPYDPRRVNRSSLRHPFHDYGTPEAYAFELTTHERRHLFGHIDQGRMCVNRLGAIVWTEWLRTPKIRPNVVLDAFIVMPDHIHGIVLLRPPSDEREDLSAGSGVPSDAGTRLPPSSLRDDGMPPSPSQTLGAIVRGLKGAVTRQINELRNLPDEPVWAPDYWDRILHTETALAQKRRYIRQNPEAWWRDPTKPSGPEGKRAIDRTGWG